MANLIKLVCILLSTLFANFVIMIVLPLYPIVAASRGMTQSEIGVVFSIYPLFSFITSLQVSRLISWLGSRNVVTLGLLCNSLSVFGFTLLSSLNNEFFLLVSIGSRAIGGFGLACIYVGNLRLIQKDYPGKRENYTSLMEAFGGIGLMLSPTYCTLMYDFLGFSGLYFVMFLVLLAFCPLYWCCAKPNAVVQSAGQPEELTIMMKVNRNLSIDFSMLVYGYTVLCFLEPTASLYLAEKGVEESTIGLIFSGCTLCYTLTNFFMAWLANFVRLERFSSTGVMICAAAIALTGPIAAVFDQVWICMACVVVNGIGVATGFACVMPAMVKEIGLSQFKKDGMMFELSSVYSMGMNTGEIIGAAVSGVLVQFLGFPMSCALISCVGAGLMIAHCLFRQRHLLIDKSLLEEYTSTSIIS